MGCLGKGKKLKINKVAMPAPAAVAVLVIGVIASPFLKNKNKIQVRQNPDFQGMALQGVQLAKRRLCFVLYLSQGGKGAFL